MNEQQKAFSNISKGFILIVFILTGFSQPLIAQDHIILHNLDVPLGATLAKQYAKLHKLNPKKTIIGLSMPFEEEISTKEFKEKIHIPLLKKLAELKIGVPKTMLCVYGVPMYVKDKTRTRSVDQLLSIPFWRKDLGNKVIGNPYYTKKGHQHGHPLFVCRLDAPTPNLVMQLMTRWKDHHKFGPFRRYLVSEKDKVLKLMMDEHYLFTHIKKDTDLMNLKEVQYETLSEKELMNKFKKMKKRKYAHGTLIIQKPSSEYSDEAFRSEGENGASAAISLGASFYIGRTKKSHAKEDLFDTLHFFERYLTGASFADAAYGSLVNLSGSMIIIGDPLAKPFAEDSLKAFEEFYNKSQIPEDDKKFLYQHLFAKDWWLLRPALEDIRKSKPLRAVGILRMAQIQRQHNLIYSETLMRLYADLGKPDEINKLKKKIGASKYKTPWHMYLINAK